MKIKIILLTLIAAVFNLSYRNTGKKPVREIVVNSGDSVIVAHLSSGESKIKTSMRKTYYWHRQGKILHNVGDYSGTLLENEYQVFLEDKLILSGQFYKGTKNGKWITWHSDGTLDNVLYYKKGVLRNKKFKPLEKIEKSERQIEKRDAKKSEKPKKHRKKTKNADKNTEEVHPDEPENNAIEINET